MRARFKNINLKEIIHLKHEEEPKVHNDVTTSSSSSPSYTPIVLVTDYASINARYYKSCGTSKSAIIFIGGVAGGYDSPSNELYPRLCEDFIKPPFNISCLRIHFRFSRKIGECVYDVLTAVDFLKNHEGIDKIGIVGHSLGAAVAIQGM